MRLASSFLVAVLGGVVSCAIAWWAANQWTSFSDAWLFLSLILPAFGAIGGLRLKTPKGEWPPRTVDRFVLALICALTSGLASYVAFALVSTTWNQVSYDGVGGFLDILTRPDSIPSLSSRRGSSSTGMQESVYFHAGLCTIFGAFVPFTWFRDMKK